MKQQSKTQSLDHPLRERIDIPTLLNQLPVDPAGRDICIKAFQKWKYESITQDLITLIEQRQEQEENRANKSLRSKGKIQKSLSVRTDITHKSDQHIYGLIWTSQVVELIKNISITDHVSIRARLVFAITQQMNANLSYLLEKLKITFQFFPSENTKNICEKSEYNTPAIENYFLSYDPQSMPPIPKFLHDPTSTTTTLSQLVTSLVEHYKNQGASGCATALVLLELQEKLFQLQKDLLTLYHTKNANIPTYDSSLRYDYVRLRNNTDPQILEIQATKKKIIRHQDYDQNASVLPELSPSPLGALCIAGINNLNQVTSTLNALLEGQNFILSQNAITKGIAPFHKYLGEFIASLEEAYGQVAQQERALQNFTIIVTSILEATCTITQKMQAIMHSERASSFSSQDTLILLRSLQEIFAAMLQIHNFGTEKKLSVSSTKILSIASIKEELQQIASKQKLIEKAHQKSERESLIANQLGTVTALEKQILGNTPSADKKERTQRKQFSSKKDKKQYSQPEKRSQKPKEEATEETYIETSIEALIYTLNTAPLSTFRVEAPGWERLALSKNLQKLLHAVPRNIEAINACCAELLKNPKSPVTEKIKALQVMIDVNHQAAQEQYKKLHQRYVHIRGLLAKKIIIRSVLGDIQDYQAGCIELVTAWSKVITWTKQLYQLAIVTNNLLSPDQFSTYLGFLTTVQQDIQKNIETLDQHPTRLLGEADRVIWKIILGGWKKSFCRGLAAMGTTQIPTFATFEEVMRYCTAQGIDYTETWKHGVLEKVKSPDYMTAAQIEENLNQLGMVQTTLQAKLGGLTLELSYIPFTPSPQAAWDTISITTLQEHQKIIAELVNAFASPDTLLTQTCLDNCEKILKEGSPYGPLLKTSLPILLLEKKSAADCLKYAQATYNNDKQSQHNIILFAEILYALGDTEKADELSAKVVDADSTAHLMYLKKIYETYGPQALQEFIVANVSYHYAMTILKHGHMYGDYLAPETLQLLAERKVTWVLQYCDLEKQANTLGPLCALMLEFYHVVGKSAAWPEDKRIEFLAREQSTITTLADAKNGDLTLEDVRIFYGIIAQPAQALTPSKPAAKKDLAPLTQELSPADAKPVEPAPPKQATTTPISGPSKSWADRVEQEEAKEAQKTTKSATAEGLSKKLPAPADTSPAKPAPLTQGSDKRTSWKNMASKQPPENPHSSQAIPMLSRTKKKTTWVTMSATKANVPEDHRGSKSPL